MWKDGMPQAPAPGSIPELRALPWKKARHIAAGLRCDVLKRDKHRRQSCGRTAGEAALEADHTIPVSKSGTSTMDNVITLCIDCNRGKSAL
ncbi:MAG: HNH endonuclease [Treponema sp.]|nr:HNH endonuclease [Treponema sp.]